MAGRDLSDVTLCFDHHHRRPGPANPTSRRRPALRERVAYFNTPPSYYWGLWVEYEDIIRPWESGSKAVGRGKGFSLLIQLAFQKIPLSRLTGYPIFEVGG